MYCGIITYVEVIYETIMFYGAPFSLLGPAGPWQPEVVWWQPLVPSGSWWWLQARPPQKCCVGLRGRCGDWSRPWWCYPLPGRWWYRLSCRQKPAFKCREKEFSITFSGLDKERVKSPSSGILSEIMKTWSRFGRRPALRPSHEMLRNAEPGGKW